MPGRCLEGVCKGSVRSLKDVWKGSRRVWDVSGPVKSGQVKSGQVKSGQVQSGQFRSGQVRSGQVKLKQEEVNSR